MAYAPLGELLAYREKILNDEDERNIITTADPASGPPAVAGPRRAVSLCRT